MERALASSLQGIPALAAFEDVAADRLDGIDLTSLLVYLVQTVDASALPYLAQQFDVLGLKGYGLAVTESERRQVIARAIELSKYRGTPYGIKYALELIGYPNSAVIERLGFLYNGVFEHDGIIDYGGGQWATFAVWVNNGLTEDPVDIDLIRKMVDIYKNVRSSLVQIIFVATVSDLTFERIDGIYCKAIVGGVPELIAVNAEALEFFGESLTTDVYIKGDIYEITIADIEIAQE